MHNIRIEHVSMYKGYYVNYRCIYANINKQEYD